MDLEDRDRLEYLMKRSASLHIKDEDRMLEYEMNELANVVRPRNRNKFEVDLLEYCLVRGIANPWKGYVKMIAKPKKRKKK